MPPKKIGRKRYTRRPRRALARRPRITRNPRNVPEYASMSETRTIFASGGLNFTSNVNYSFMNTALVGFSRASRVASAYQYFRIKQIKLTFRSTLDSFTPAGPTSKTYLYYMIDKSGTLPSTISLDGLKALGARPRALDEKPISIIWKPSVLTGAMTQGGSSFIGQGAKYTISPWLATNSQTVLPNQWAPSTVDHLGVYWFVDTANNADKIVYEVDMEAQFEFKKPFLIGVQSEFPATPAVFAQQNNSRDGVVDPVDMPGDDQELVVP